MADMLTAVTRLYQIRELINALSEEAEKCRQVILSLGNGNHAVGDFLVAIENIVTTRYTAVLREFLKRHPEFATEIDELSKQFQTTTQRVRIEKMMS